MNSGGKSGAEWSRRSGARSCRELPVPLYLPWRKDWPAAAAEPFFPARLQWGLCEKGLDGVAIEYRGMEVKEGREGRKEGREQREGSGVGGGGCRRREGTEFAHAHRGAPTEHGGPAVAVTQRRRAGRLNQS